MNFVKFLRTSFLQNNSGRLLLSKHTRFSWERYLLLRKSRSSYGRCSVKEGLQLYQKWLQYCEIFKNTYLEKHLGRAASENQHQIFQRKGSYFLITEWFYHVACIVNESLLLLKSCNIKAKSYNIFIIKKLWS